MLAAALGRPLHRSGTGGGIEVNPGLLNLIALQELEQKIAANQKQIAELPTVLQGLHQQIGTLKEDHEQKVTYVQEQTKRRRALEGEVEMMRTKLSRLRDQLMAVKTNKEYTAMQHEIQTAEEQIRLEEDKILEIMEDLEGMEGKLREEERELKSSVAALEDEIGRREASVPGIEAELARLESEKVDLETRIELEWLERYRRIAGARKGIALAEARDELCTACHVRIRPQVYAELRLSEVIHTCDSCSRILYLRD